MSNIDLTKRLSPREKRQLVRDLNEEVAQLLNVPKKEVNPVVLWENVMVLGQYNPKTKNLMINKNIVKPMTIRNVILHELCHVYDGSFTKGMISSQLEQILIQNGIFVPKDKVWDPHGEGFRKIADKVEQHWNIKINATGNGNVQMANGRKEQSIAKIVCKECGHIAYLVEKNKYYYCPDETKCKKCGNKGFTLYIKGNEITPGEYEWIEKPAEQIHKESQLNMYNNIVKKNER